MKRFKLLLAVLLVAAMAVFSVAGSAEPAADQPAYHLVESSFLSWIDAYSPGASIEWGSWDFTLWLESEYLSVSGMLLEDASSVQKITLTDDRGITQDILDILSELCADLDDTVSEENLQKLQSEGYARVTSDAEKITVSGDGNSLFLEYSPDLPQAPSLETVADAVARAGQSILFTSTSRDGSLPENEYSAQVYLNGAGALRQITFFYSGDDSEAGLAYLLEAAGLMVSGDTLDSARALIRDKWPSVLSGGDMVMEPIDSFFFMISGSDGIEMVISAQSVPDDASPFIETLE